MMKKRLFTVLATLAVSIPTFALAACGDDTPTTKKPKLTHEEAVEATCTTEGHKEYWTDGNKIYSDKNGKTEVTLADLTVSKKDHTPASTYKSAGANGHYHVCTVCSNAADAVVEHSWGDWIVDLEPGETTTGSKHQECTADGCGYKKPEETIPAIGVPKELTSVAENASTCVTAGNIAYWTDGEGHYYSDEKGEHEITLADTVSPLAAHTVGEMTYDSTDHWHLCAYTNEGEHVYKDAQGKGDNEGHKLGGWVIDEGHEPGETTEGLRHKECTVDGCDYVTESVTAPALGVKIYHEYKDSTCTEEGNVECWEKGGVYYSDEECTTELEGKFEIDKKQHEYVDSYDETNHYKECSVCKGKIDVEGHTCTADVKEPTCTEGGMTTYTCDCGYSYEDEDSATEATGHSYAAVWSWSENNDSATVTLKCDNCDDEHDDIEATITTDTTDSTCTEKGNTTYTATLVYDGKTYTDEKLVELELADHTWSEDWSSDDENHWHACICGERKDEAKHTGGEATTEKKAECEVCGEEYGKLLPIYNGEALTIEAEDAALTGKCYPQDSSGIGFVGALDTGDTITYTFHSQSENKVELLLAVANGFSTIDKAFMVSVNGGEEFSVGADHSEPGYLTFVDKHVTYLELEADTKYTVKFEVWSAGGVNLDCLKIVPWDGEEPDIPPIEEDLPSYDGEELVLQAENSEHTALTGSAHAENYYVCGLATGDTITFKINSTVEQNVELILAYANGNAAKTKAFRVEISEDDPFTFDVETIQSGGWTVFDERTVAGYKFKANTKYTIKFTVLNVDGVNLDYLKIVPWTKGEMPELPYEEPPAYDGNAALVLKAGVDASIEGDYTLSNGAVGGLMKGSELTFKFKAAVSGKAELVLAATPNANDITFNVTLNGNALSPLTINSGDTLVQVLDLVEDTNYTVVFTAGDNVRNNVNIISFKVIPYVAHTQADLPLTYGAADVTPLNGCDFQNHEKGYQGHIIGNINSKGRGIAFSLTVAEEMTAHLSVFADSDPGSGVEFEAFVDGVSVGTCKYTSTWVAFDERDMGNITLAAGKHTIEIKLVSGGMNFSHLILSPATAD